VLTGYAERRLTQATGVGRDKILSSLPQLLRESAGVYEKYTVELARTCDFVVMQLPMEEQACYPILSPSLFATFRSPR
jgi:hypothetical protein